jgi:transcriptional regulator GlxA family with amidase domain
VLKVGFVLTPEFPVMSLAALSVFEFANVTAGKKLYELQVLSEGGGEISAHGGVAVASVAFAHARFDTLIIGGNTRVVPTSDALISFIVRAAKTVRRISSICTGVFALADAGLLHGKRVTTHWLFAEQFAGRFPDIELQEDRLFVVDGSIWTAAGNSAGIDLALCMLEHDHGSELALNVARIMVVDYQRSGGQSQRSALLGVNPKSDRIQSTLTFARNNLQASLSVERLAHVAGLGPRQFSRAFRAETRMSPAKAVESLRLEAARRMLEQSAHPIDTIALETGFGDEERMRRAFIRVVGHSPQAIRRYAKGGDSTQT